MRSNAVDSGAKHLSTLHFYNLNKAHSHCNYGSLGQHLCTVAYSSCSVCVQAFQEGGVEITPFEDGEMMCCRLESLSTLTTNAAGKLDVFGHDCDTLGVNGSQVGVLEEANQVGLSCLLKS